MFSIFNKEPSKQLNKPLTIKRMNNDNDNIDIEIAMTKAKILAVDKEIFLLDQHIKDIKSHNK